MLKPARSHTPIADQKSAHQSPIPMTVRIVTGARWLMRAAGIAFLAYGVYLIIDWLTWPPPLPNDPMLLARSEGGAAQSLVGIFLCIFGTTTLFMSVLIRSRYIATRIAAAFLSISISLLIMMCTLLLHLSQPWVLLLFFFGVCLMIGTSITLFGYIPHQDKVTPHV